MSDWAVLGHQLYAEQSAVLQHNALQGSTATAAASRVAALTPAPRSTLRLREPEAPMTSCTACGKSAHVACRSVATLQAGVIGRWILLQFTPSAKRQPPQHNDAFAQVVAFAPDRGLHLVRVSGVHAAGAAHLKEGWWLRLHRDGNLFELIVDVGAAPLPATTGEWAWVSARLAESEGASAITWDSDVRGLVSSVQNNKAVPPSPIRSTVRSDGRANGASSTEALEKQWCWECQTDAERAHAALHVTVEDGEWLLRARAPPTLAVSNGSTALFDTLQRGLQSFVERVSSRAFALPDPILHELNSAHQVDFTALPITRVAIPGAKRKRLAPVAPREQHPAAARDMPFASTAKPPRSTQKKKKPARKRAPLPMPPPPPPAVEIPTCARTRPWIVQERTVRPAAKRTRRRGSASTGSASAGPDGVNASQTHRVAAYANDEIAAVEESAKAIEVRSREKRISVRQRRIGTHGAHEAAALNTEVRVRFGRSNVQGWGVFAVDAIRAADMILEYRGEIIRSTVADVRERRRRARAFNDDYIWRVGKNTCIDATQKGSLARFVNHSCDPNCYVAIVPHAGTKVICIFGAFLALLSLCSCCCLLRHVVDCEPRSVRCSTLTSLTLSLSLFPFLSFPTTLSHRITAKRDIAPSEELVYSYNFDLAEDESERVPCFCGSALCTGFMN